MQVTEPPESKRSKKLTEAPESKIESAQSDELSRNLDAIQSKIDGEVRLRVGR